MDRRNGGDPLAPPRPPKLLPRVHRPRAPEPTIMSETTVAPIQTTRTTATTTAAVPAVAVATIESVTTATITPQCTNSNQQQPQQHLSSSNNNHHHFNHQQQQHHSITTAAATTTNLHSSSGSSNNNNNSNNSFSSSQHHFNSNNNNDVAVISTEPLCESDYQIHHLTFLPQRPSSLSRNSSHVSSSSSSSITAANSFTRRRPLPPTPSLTAPGAAVPLLNISGNSSNNSSINSNSIASSLLSHFHSADPVPASPVTLAQPRPESERLTNEYVDTPLRTAQQLQHATRTQHPAGQHDSGQTTTHHLLLLPQRELRLQQQQLQQQHQQQQLHHHQQHSSNRLAGTAGSATVTTLGGGGGTDGTDGFLHSHHNHHHQQQHSTNNGKTSASSATTAQTTTTACPLTGKLTTTRIGDFASSGVQPITQPITKQPASTSKFAKDLHALDDLLDLHNISTGIATPQGMVSAVNGASPLGTPIIIGGDPATTLNTITCPRCNRCRCEQCQSPRPLPQTWVCNKACLCSAESVIDYASCLCCPKALFYHCARDNDMDCDDGSGTPCVDNPCSCGPYKRTQRWGWLGALSLVLPCLWCYWPMRGCVALCEKCYGRYAGRGCRCQPIGSTSSMLQLAVNGNNSMLGNGIGGAGNANQSASKSLGGAGSKGSAAHHHHHNECSAASRILRKGDLTPEKRLLDSSPEY